MANLELIIKTLKQKIKRHNIDFLRRRIEKGNGKKTLGWIMKSDELNLYKENIDINELFKEIFDKDK